MKSPGAHLWSLGIFIKDLENGIECTGVKLTDNINVYVVRVTAGNWIRTQNYIINGKMVRNRMKFSNNKYKVLKL